MPKLRSLPPEVRRQRALEFVGKEVQVTTTSAYQTETRIGQVLAVAIPNVGSVADMLILQPRHDDPTQSYVFAKALSLAGIDDIQEV